jgi:hypothetical protein
VGWPKARVYSSRQFIENAEQVGDECGRHDSLLLSHYVFGVDRTLPPLYVAFVIAAELLQAKGVGECEGVPRHLRDGARRFAPGAPDPGAVEQDDVVFIGEAVGDLRVSVAQVGAKVLHEDEREPA